MKTAFRSILAATVLGLAPMFSRAAGPDVGMRVATLNALVKLSVEQKARAAQIFTDENAILDAFATPMDRATGGMDARTSSRADIHEMLTPDQRIIYDTSPQSIGGGATVTSSVAPLDALVKLSPDQKARANAVFANENAILNSFRTSKDAMEKGSEARSQARAEIRAILTPEQRNLYDISPQALGGGSMVNPEMLLRRLDQVVALTEAQKAKATTIIWNEHLDQVAATPADQPPKGFFWSQAVRDQLRAILTPAQQAKFDVTPPFRSSAKTEKTGG